MSDKKKHDDPTEVTERQSVPRSDTFTVRNPLNGTVSFRLGGKQYVLPPHGVLELPNSVKALPEWKDTALKLTVIRR